ncbi:MAG: outer membrane beta-barrel protein, partial [Bacteroidota bacterium]|nr:outer membrane beta-barrel protein [Bacteroidota bacterium]
GYSTQMMLGMGRPFKQNMFVINTFGMFRFNKDISYASNKQFSSGATSSDILSNMPPQNMTTTITGMYNLGFTINLRTFTMTASGRATYNKAAYTISSQQNTEYTNYAATMNAGLTLFKTVRLITDCSYTTNNGLSAGYNQNTILWNGNITKDFFKDKRAQIKVQLYDILGQNVSIRRNTTENYIEDVQSKVLTRYFLVSFIYNFNKFLGAQKAQQPQDDHQFMPGMRMGGFRRGGGGGGFD